MQYADVLGFVAKLREHTGFAALAFRFLILTACRTGEVLGAQWEEIDKGTCVWIGPGEWMKAGREHRVPLSQAALDVLSEAEKLKLNEFVSPGQKPGRPLSNMALLMQLRRFDQKDVTAHGFRSAFSRQKKTRPRFTASLAASASHRMIVHVGRESVLPKSGGIVHGFEKIRESGDQQTVGLQRRSAEGDLRRLESALPR